MFDTDARARTQPIQLFLFACEWMIAPRFFIEPDVNG